MKILLIAALVWFVILVGSTTYTVPHMYGGETKNYSVCNDIVNTCFFFDGKSIIKMEG